MLYTGEIIDIFNGALETLVLRFSDRLYHNLRAYIINSIDFYSTHCETPYPMNGHCVKSDPHEIGIDFKHEEEYYCCENYEESIISAGASHYI